jgi:DNA-binding transcriptional LysR family regulator
MLARFRALRPGVDVAIREALTVEELVEGVERGEVDVAFAVLPFADGPFEVRDLLRDPYVLVTRAGGDERGLVDVDGKRLLGIRRCVHEHFVEARLLAEGIAPASVARFDDNGMIQALARAGEGVAVVPRLTVDPDDGGVEVHELPELAARQIVAVWHRERHLSAAARQLVDVAVEVCAAA